MASLLLLGRYVSSVSYFSEKDVVNRDSYVTSFVTGYFVQHVAIYVQYSQHDHCVYESDPLFSVDTFVVGLRPRRGVFSSSDIVFDFPGPES